MPKPFLLPGKEKYVTIVAINTAAIAPGVWWLVSEAGKIWGTGVNEKRVIRFLDKMEKSGA